MNLFIAAVIVIAILLVLSKIGEAALERGWFWLFLALTGIVSLLFLGFRSSLLDAVTR